MENIHQHKWHKFSVVTETIFSINENSAKKKIIEKSKGVFYQMWNNAKDLKLKTKDSGWIL